jgi:hypothetical protein
MHPIEDIIGPVLGHPSWLVQRGHGSFVTMEFGEPQLHTGEPKLRKTFIDGVAEQSPQRCSYGDGQWRLWIYCCEWWLLLEGTLLAHSESDDLRMLHRAQNVLNGQKLTELDIEPGDGGTRFNFDLGCSLLTRPAPPGSDQDEPDEQWKLYLRSGNVLVVRADGSYMISDRHEKPSNWRWLPISNRVHVHA